MKSTTINGEAYFRVRKTVGYEYNENGERKPILKSFYGKTKKEVNEKYKAYIENKNADKYTNQMRFGSIADKWIQNNFIPDTTLNNRSKRLYLNAWKRNVANSSLYNVALEDVTFSRLQAFFHSLTCGASTTESVLKMMRRFYQYLEIEMDVKNIAKAIKIAKPVVHSPEESEITVWSDSEIKRILAFENLPRFFRLRFLIVLGYYTGCRQGELLAITYDDFTPNGLRINKQIQEEPQLSGKKQSINYIVTSTKTQSSNRYVPIHAEVWKELQKHRLWHEAEMEKKGYHTNYVFTTSSGKFLDRRNVGHALKTYYERNGIEYKNFHVFRHTFASNLVKFGTPIETVSKILGHDSIQTTFKYYVNVGNTEQKRAIEMLSAVGKAKNNYANDTQIIYESGKAIDLIPVKMTKS